MTKQRKFLITSIVAILALCSVFLVACDNNGQGLDKKYTMVDFDITKDLDVSVASYNMAGGLLTQDKIDAISAYLDEEKFDMVGLQEVDNKAKRSGKIDYIEEIQGEIYKNYFYNPLNVAGMGKTYGLGVVTQHEIKYQDAVTLPYKSGTERRKVIRTVIMVDGVPVVFYSTHLSYEDKETRTKQIQALNDYIKADPNPYKVLVGDFNVESVDELKVFEDAGMKAVFESGFSFEEGDAKGLIDNILISSTLEVTSSEIVGYDLIQDKNGNNCSDHKLIKANIKKAA